MIMIFEIPKPESLYLSSVYLVYMYIHTQLNKISDTQ